MSGIYLAADRWDFSEVFIGWGIVAVLVLLGLVHGVFIPTERRAQEAAERDLEASGTGGGVEFGEALTGPTSGWPSWGRWPA